MRRRTTGIPLPRSIALICGLLAVGTCFVTSCLDDLPEYRGPYLSWTENPATSMTITWETIADQDFELRWGPAGEELENTISLATAERRDDRYYHHTVTLRGLAHETEYQYEITGIQDAKASFKTASDSATDSFRFLVYGDSCEIHQDKDNEHYDVVRAMDNTFGPRERAFVVSTGDISVSSGAIHSWDLHFDAIRELANRTPYFTPFGNHEWKNYDIFDVHQPPTWIHEFPSEHTSSPGVSGFDTSSYSLEVGSVLFILIGYDKVGVSAGHPFNAWLKAQLIKGQDLFSFTFVAFHKPPFDRRACGYMDNVAMLEYQAQLFHEYGVSMVFSGHNHVFAHHEIDLPSANGGQGQQVTYIISGGGGQDLRKALKGTWNNRHGFGFVGETVFTKSLNHFVAVEIDGGENTAALTAYDIGGTPFYGPFVKQGRLP